MMVNTNNIVPMTDANQNFSKVVRLVDENGMAIPETALYIKEKCNEYDNKQR